MVQYVYQYGEDGKITYLYNEKAQTLDVRGRGGSIMERYWQFYPLPSPNNNNNNKNIYNKNNYSTETLYKTSNKNN